MKGLPFVEFDHSINYKVAAYPVLVTKGCYWDKCTFCDYVLMGDLGDDRYMARPVEEVYQEMKEFRKQVPHAEFVLISDAVPPSWYKKLAKMANAENFKLWTKSYMINNKSLNDEFFREISQAEVRGFTFGTESTSDRVLNLMQKQANQKVIIENLKLAKKYGVKVKVNLIPNYPSTTYKEALAACRIIDLFSETISQIAAFKFYLSANTSMFKNPKEFNLQVDKAPYMKSNHNGYHTVQFKTEDGMTPEEETKIYRIISTINSKIIVRNELERVKSIIKRDEFNRVSFKSTLKLDKKEDFSVFHDYSNGVFMTLTKEQEKLIEEVFDPSMKPKFSSLLELKQTKKDKDEKINQLVKLNLLKLSA